MNISNNDPSTVLFKLLYNAIKDISLEPKEIWTYGIGIFKTEYSVCDIKIKEYAKRKDEEIYNYYARNKSFLDKADNPLLENDINLLINTLYNISHAKIYKYKDGFSNVEKLDAKETVELAKSIIKKIDQHLK